MGMSESGISFSHPRPDQLMIVDLGPVHSEVALALPQSWIFSSVMMDLLLTIKALTVRCSILATDVA
jgi:hypothetical protein